MPPVECPTMVMRPMPSEASSAWVFPASCWNAVLVMCRLSRFAEPDLIGSDDAVAGVAQYSDGVLPGRRAEILAVQQQDRAAIRRLWLHVHIGHVEGLALRGEGEVRHRPGILEALQLRPVGGAVIGGTRPGRGRRQPWRRRSRCRERRAAQRMIRPSTDSPPRWGRSPKPPCYDGRPSGAIVSLGSKTCLGSGRNGSPVGSGHARWKGVGDTVEGEPFESWLRLSGLARTVP